jgi:monoamine oxidase
MRGDVIVVGAGVAGLAAAGSLAEAGRRVLLLEARRRLGGRIHTALDPAFGHPIEFGAEFVQGEAPDFLRTIQALGLELNELPEGHERARGDIELPLSAIEALVDRLLGLRSPEAEDVPVSQLIRQQAAERFTSEELEALTAYLEGFHGADLDRFGTAALAENQAAQTVDGDRMFRVAGGYGQLVSRLAGRLQSNRAEVRAETVVTRLRWEPGQVRIEARTHSGDTIELAGSQAIVTVPLGTLKAERGSEGAVVFDPEPPGWQDALAALEMGAAQRIDLRFDTAWWMDDNRLAPMFVHGKDQPFPVWWATSPPELPFLTGWVGGPRAVALAGRSHNEMVRLALQSASGIFGVPVRTLDGWLRAAYSHDWFSDPFARGAYSYGGVGASAAREALSKPVADTLFLAGEAIVTDGRNATVPGALSSGIRAAAAALEVPVAALPR